MCVCERERDTCPLLTQHLCPIIRTHHLYYCISLDFKVFHVASPFIPKRSTGRNDEIWSFAESRIILECEGTFSQLQLSIYGIAILVNELACYTSIQSLLY